MRSERHLRRTGVALVVVLGATACVPNTYMGLDTKAPYTMQERFNVAMAQRGLPGTRGDCGLPGNASIMLLPPTTQTPRVPGSQMACALMPLSALSLGAWMGDRHAQFELGRRFEQGRGVRKDLKVAEKLYKRAAETRGGPLSTCVWDEYTKSCNHIQIDLPYDYGLPEAARERDRLRAYLETREGPARP